MLLPARRGRPAHRRTTADACPPGYHGPASAPSRPSPAAGSGTGPGPVQPAAGPAPGHRGTPFRCAAAAGACGHLAGRIVASAIGPSSTASRACGTVSGLVPGRALVSARHNDALCHACLHSRRIRSCQGVSPVGQHAGGQRAIGAGSHRERELAGDTAGFEELMSLGGFGQAQGRLQVHA